MGKEIKLPLISITIFVLSIFHLTMAMEQTYIVHMAKDEQPQSFPDHLTWYASSLASVSDSAKTSYIYENVLDGFSTSLTPQQADALKTRPGVIAVTPADMIYQLHTTRTPFFLGLEKSTAFLPNTSLVSEVIVGVLDTGVWPESQSFRDDGLGAIPSHWKGGCENASDFKSSYCDKKLIGAKSFSKGYLEFLRRKGKKPEETISPRDVDGHGTFTASTATGSGVQGANLFGLANGTARGMAISARVAVYKACWGPNGLCLPSDILAAMDQAISDGVHMLSISMGGGAIPYYEDPIAKGAFSVVGRGILVSCSAGNDGPDASSLSNVAPWIVTVGAGTLDRDFPAEVRLGDNRVYSGMSLSKSQPVSGTVVYAGDVSTNGSLCMNGTLIPNKVRNKIVLCDRGVINRVEKGAVVKQAGGVAMVLANSAENGEELTAEAHLLPAIAVGFEAGNNIRLYVLSKRSKAMASLVFKGTRVGIKPAPTVAIFSSRGPNKVTPEILKPDLIAPGLNILASWTRAAGPTGLPIDTRKVDFNIVSGTSMSCPHVSGLAALLKAAHPEWSPAAIRSALMTTAYSTYADGSPMLDLYTGKWATPFTCGSGHVNPVPALEPGLVYNLTTSDYFHFFCAINYTSSQIQTIARNTRFRCDPNWSYSVSDLNYPSFASTIPSGKGNTTVVFRRRLTNVGQPGTYRVSISLLCHSATIYVTPQTLVFCGKNEVKSFKLTVVAAPMVQSGTNVFGRIEWSNGKNVVASPVAISWT